MREHEMKSLGPAGWGKWKQSYSKSSLGIEHLLGSYYFHFPEKVILWLAEILGRAYEKKETVAIFENDGILDYHPNWGDDNPHTTRLREDEVAALVNSNPEMKGAWILEKMRR